MGVAHDASGADTDDGTKVLGKLRLLFDFHGDHPHGVGWAALNGPSNPGLILIRADRKQNRTPSLLE